MAACSIVQTIYMKSVRSRNLVCSVSLLETQAFAIKIEYKDIEMVIFMVNYTINYMRGLHQIFGSQVQHTKNIWTHSDLRFCEMRCQKDLK